VSEYDQGHAKQRLDKLAQTYGVEVVRLSAAEQGLLISGITTNADGTMTVEVDLPEYQYAQTYV
jgi:hypothetical protein